MTESVPEAGCEKPPLCTTVAVRRPHHDLLVQRVTLRMHNLLANTLLMSIFCQLLLLLYDFDPSVG
jgi:hypothetical protein